MRASCKDELVKNGLDIVHTKQTTVYQLLCVSHRTTNGKLSVTFTPIFKRTVGYSLDYLHAQSAVNLLNPLDNINNEYDKSIWIASTYTAVNLLCCRWVSIVCHTE